MKALRDPGQVLTDGLRQIRAEQQLPDRFPDEVVVAAEGAARRAPTAHRDRTDQPFVTLDPATSEDLDQAFSFERSGADWLLHYAIADVGWFVDEGGAIDREAWTRGTSQYLPDGKVSLYPRVLSEGAASLLPGVDRPCVLFTTRVRPDGQASLDAVERALIRSRAKLAYATVAPTDLPNGFAEVADRIARAEAARGASRSDPPEQEVVKTASGYQLRLRPQLLAERQNAALSLATNLAVAALLLKHRTGLFRVMPEPPDWALRRLRHTADALGVNWPTDTTIREMEGRLDATDPAQAALILAIRRASAGASYAPFRDDQPPWHAAVAAAYAHATAPLRRLADRYVVGAALALANGQPLPAGTAEAFESLPKPMARAEALAGQIDRAVVDLAEAIVLSPRVGETFAAVVTDVDQRGARIQLCQLPVVARLKSDGLKPGAHITARLDLADPPTRTLRFTLTGTDAGGC